MRTGVGCVLLSVVVSAAAQNVAHPTLTLQQAEALAQKNNPAVSIAKLASLAQGEITRETRSGELPTVSGNVTAVDSHRGSRIAAGGLNNPVIYPRAAGGVAITQLLTDFGRTRNLMAAARLEEQASSDAVRASAADIAFAVDEAFFRTLNAERIVDVAEQEVRTRQATADQISALTAAKLRSELDRSFAEVNLQQAQLTLLNAQNEADAAMASLNTLLGNERTIDYDVVAPDETLPAPPEDDKTLIDSALRVRPDLLASIQDAAAAKKAAQADHDLFRPSISGVAAVGGSPIRADQLSPWYGAAGINLSVPIFNGFLFNARAAASDYQAQEADERVRDLRARIARDVRVTVLQARSAYQRIDVADKMLDQANLALDLAQTRYKLGLSSIVELGQAQLQQAQAAMGRENARFDYQAALAALRYQSGQ